MGLVQLENICKSFTPGVKVLDNLNLEIRPGELFFLLGPSGCGKSTLLRILSGLTEPDCGSIKFDGVEISSLPPEKRNAAMVFQNYALWPHLTVYENVAFGLRIRKFSGRELDEKVMDALESVHLADFAKRRVPSLSGGQQQRVAIARALMNEPPVLFADEPTGNLDTKSSIEIMNLFTELSREGITIVMVTHEDDIAAYANRHLLMRDGKLVKDDKIV